MNERNDDIWIVNICKTYAHDSWQQTHCIDENDWLDIFKLCCLCTTNTKLQRPHYNVWL